MLKTRRISLVVVVAAALAVVPALLVPDAARGQVKQPLPKEPEIKPRYYEAYFYKCRSLYRYAVEKKEVKYVKQAAILILALENASNSFGPDESKARFLELLSQEKELKDEYDRLKLTK